jgi:hypothetical protein
MNKITSLLIVSIVSLAVAGCQAPSGPINVNPLSPIAGTIKGGLNPGTFNPALVVEAASQCPQVGSITAVGGGVNFAWARNAPPGYVPQAVVPLTDDRVALIENDFLASQIYAMRNNHSSDDVQVSAMGVVIVVHMAYPPSVPNQTLTVTNASVTPPTTITIPGSTNAVISNIITK